MIMGLSLSDPVGVASVSDILKKMSTAQLEGTDPVSKVMLKKFEIVKKQKFKDYNNNCILNSLMLLHHLVKYRGH